MSTAKLTHENLATMDVVERIGGEPQMLSIIDTGEGIDSSVMFYTNSEAWKKTCKAKDEFPKDFDQSIEFEAYGKISHFGIEKKGVLSIYNWALEWGGGLEWKCNISFQEDKNPDSPESSCLGRSELLFGCNEKIEPSNIAL